MTVANVARIDIRRARPWVRGLVILGILIWVVLASTYPRQLQGTGILLTLILVGIDVALGVVSGWLAFRRTDDLDERQAALRDHAYRLAFRLVGVGVLLMVALVYAGFFAPNPEENPSQPYLPNGLAARQLIAFLELLIIVPTAVIAWIDPIDAEEVAERSRRWRTWTPALLIPAIAAGWLLAVAVLPIQSATLTQLPDSGFSLSGATCGHFLAKKDVGSVFGGSIRLRAEVCWDGRNAFVFGDPSLHTPMGVVPIPVPADQMVSPLTMPSLPNLTNCTTRNADTDFVAVTESCTEQVDASGTMRLIVHGRVSPLPGGLLARDVEIRLVVTPDGRVVSFN
jgi:hypothetical protein